MLVWSILSSLIMIFVLIIPGFIFKKASLLSDNQTAGINSIVVNLTWPCLVIDAMQIPFSMQTLKDSGYIFLLCVVVFVAVFIVSILMTTLIRLTKTKQYLVMFMLLFGNTGFIGIPVIRALYGDDAIFFAAIVELVNNILLFTVGIFLVQLSAGINIKMNPRQLLSPGFISVIIGLGLFLLDIRLPSLLAGSIEMIGNATTPLTMFVIGFQVAGLKIKEVIGDWQVYAFLFLRLAVVPVLALLLVKLFAGDFTLIEKVLIIDFAMPAAMVSAIFSQQYKGETAFATKSVLLSTVFSLLTIPLFAIILEL